MRRYYAGKLPTVQLPGERVAMSFRVTPEMKAKLDTAAATSGRSLSQEIELRLEQAFLIGNVTIDFTEIKRSLSILVGQVHLSQDDENRPWLT